MPFRAIDKMVGGAVSQKMCEDITDTVWIWPCIETELLGTPFTLPIIAVMLVVNLFICVWNPITTALVNNEVFRDIITHCRYQ